MENLCRYGVVNNKNYREIVLLRGRGCKRRTCAFCDYHKDSSENEAENFAINSAALSRVEGLYGTLEVVNSGSFSDLDKDTVSMILDVCKEKKIKSLHIESHWRDRDLALEYKKLFAAEEIKVIMKIGAETFDADFRSKVLNKHITASAGEMASVFDECCLLFGITGQTEQSMTADIETGLAHFKRVCVNIMKNNTARLKADGKVIKIFKEKIYPKYIRNQNIDILIDNTDFGVGRLQNAK